MFGMIIPQVLWARSPEDSKLDLFDPVVYPIETHIHGLILLLEEFLSCDAYCSVIVHLDGRGSLFPSHFRYGGADRYRCLGVDKCQKIEMDKNGSL